MKDMLLPDLLLQSESLFAKMEKHKQNPLIAGDIVETFMVLVQTVFVLILTEKQDVLLLNIFVLVHQKDN